MRAKGDVLGEELLTKILIFSLNITADIPFDGEDDWKTLSEETGKSPLTQLCLLSLILGKRTARDLLIPALRRVPDSHVASLLRLAAELISHERSITEVEPTFSGIAALDWLLALVDAKFGTINALGSTEEIRRVQEVLDAKAAERELLSELTALSDLASDATLSRGSRQETGRELYTVRRFKI
eukprot:TRINITY_DN9575_c0_g1_i4.p1 TRINITY_DN9575_c0_g1~~TRINITY_DN9575_c0_g1_i4.p1  ORF type:complete len:184 (+),score=39.53 TRINITY_DN9575_c0_g1_i4:264-815(+)